PPLDPVQAEREARQLVTEMLSQRPAKDATNTGVLKIRDANDEQHEVAVRFDSFNTPTNWVSVYETLRGAPHSKLTVLHAERTNEYFLLSNGGDSTSPKVLNEKQIMAPFAGSDFWVADLGLEFLHWPNQRLLKKEMRRNRFCWVLESSTPHPVAGGYARVVSWITQEAPHGIVHADAYNEEGDVIKRFDPTEFKKVEGQWQLEGMEIRSSKSGSKTLIEFHLK
ncbi:MAG TPA: outer membrane lipoprotein-sorting protein, partial [Candidatus Dormibacteraeota bacterium]|nr:outer membrane lipoprotein-sorting protein [Candidatus Dormibacteraeota bacterium]